MYKKFMSILLAGLLSLGTCLGASAASSGLEIDPNGDVDNSVVIVSRLKSAADLGEGGGAIPGDAPSLDAQLSNAPAAEVAARANAAQLAKTTRAVSAYNIPSITYYGQEGPYWCVPASVKMILRKMTGVAYTQSSLATALETDWDTGTPFFNALDLLLDNEEDMGFYYLGRNKGTLADMKYDVEYTITSDAPAMFCVMFEAGGWPYRMGSYHSVLATGYTSGQANFRVHDPYIKPYINSGHSGNYQVTANNLFNATHSYIY